MLLFKMIFRTSPARTNWYHLIGQKNYKILFTKIYYLVIWSKGTTTKNGQIKWGRGSIFCSCKLILARFPSQHSIIEAQEIFEWSPSHDFDKIGRRQNSRAAALQFREAVDLGILLYPPSVLIFLLLMFSLWLIKHIWNVSWAWAI